MATPTAVRIVQSLASAIDRRMVKSDLSIRRGWVRDVVAMAVCVTQ